MKILHGKFATFYFLLMPCCRKWRLGAQGSGPSGLKPTTQTQVGGTLHKPRSPPQNPNKAPVTLSSEFNGKNF